ncbi:hypothetical protein Tco_0252007 [Tanacetum coccineum]
MTIPAMMLNDDIKAFAKHLEYLAKSKGSKPIKATGRGKGLLTKQGFEIVVERVIIPKRRQSKTVVEEVGQSKEVVEGVDSKETDEEPPVKEDQLLNMKKARKASKDEFFIQQCLRSSGQGSGAILEVPDELIHKSSNEGSSVNPAVLDEPRDSSSSLSSASKDEIKDI